MAHNMRRPFLRIGMILGGIVLAAFLALLFGLLVMLLWNWIMPEVFGLKPLTYWQSWGIVLLAHILFKAGGKADHSYHKARDEEWKDRFRERFKARFWVGKEGDKPEPPPQPPPEEPRSS
jgi:magnesium-transporting ATPase (P-type)